MKKRPQNIIINWRQNFNDLQNQTRLLQKTRNILIVGPKIFSSNLATLGALRLNILLFIYFKCCAVYSWKFELLFYYISYNLNYGPYQTKVH